MSDPIIYQLRSQKCSHLHEISVKPEVTTEIIQAVKSGEKIQLTEKPKYTAQVILNCMAEKVRRYTDETKNGALNNLIASLIDFEPFIIYKSIPSNNQILNEITIQVLDGTSNVLVYRVFYNRIEYLNYNIAVGDDLDVLIVNELEKITRDFYNKQQFNISSRLNTNILTQPDPSTQIAGIKINNTTFGYLDKIDKKKYAKISLKLNVYSNSENEKIVRSMLKSIEIDKAMTINQTYQMENIKLGEQQEIINISKFIEDNTY